MRIHPFIVALASVLVIGIATFVADECGERGALAGGGPERFSGPTQSGPIAVTPDDRYLWVANPDNNSVSVLEVEGDVNRKLAEIPVGIEPRNVAIAPDGKTVYVSNTVSGTVSVIRANPRHPRVERTIRVGTEPYGMAFTPNGSRLYVANARSNDVSVIRAGKDKVSRTITGVGLEPRGVAVTNDGDGDDRDEKVYVTQFLAVDRPLVTIGKDDYKEGRVTVISTANNRVVGQVILNPMNNTGFNSIGSVLEKVAVTDPPHPTKAFPNMLNALAIKDGRLYLPSTAASPDGPVKFNVNVQAMLSVVDLATDTEAGSQTINMNRGINLEPPGKLFVAVPWALAFAHHAPTGYVVASAANIVVKVDLDPTGTPTINAPSGIVRIPTGQNPRGIAINARDDRAYVTNEVSRDVTVIDLATNAVIATIPAADLPIAGSAEADLLVGKGLFFSSTGVRLPALGADIPLRLSSEGWSGCVSCHPFGLTDGVVWIFGTGPRRTLPLNGTFNPRDPNDIKILNDSAVNDEIQDFELNIRNVSGGLGLITLAAGDSITPFIPPNTLRSTALDLLARFVAVGIRTPISPLARIDRGRHDDRDHHDMDDDHTGDGDEDGIGHGDGEDDHDRRDGHHQDGRDVEKGRRLFAEANCMACHGGGGWASSRRDYEPPPPATTEIKDKQLVQFLHKVGTFNPLDDNELRANGKPAAGLDGFVPPSLLGAHGMAPFLHNGSAPTLADVIENPVHRSAGTPGVDHLADLEDRARLAAFLASIDASTEPFPITPLAAAHAANREAPLARAGAAPAGALALALASANPSHGGTSLRYVLPLAGRVDLEIFDLGGRRVASLTSGIQAAGVHRASWDGRTAGGARAAAGVYMARLRSAGGVRLAKVVRAR